MKINYIMDELGYYAYRWFLMTVFYEKMSDEKLMNMIDENKSSRHESELYDE